MDESLHAASKATRPTTKGFAMGLVMMLLLPPILCTALSYLAEVGECPSAIE